MNCPICAGEGLLQERLKVVDSRPTATGVDRVRRCDRGQHRFTTSETLFAGTELDLQIERSSTETEPFSRGHLHADLTKALLKSVPRSEISDLATEVSISLRVSHPEGGIVPSRDVIDTVQQLLRHRHGSRVPIVLYSLAFMGRVDHPDPLRKGFTDAYEFLEWFLGQFPDLVEGSNVEASLLDLADARQERQSRGAQPLPYSEATVTPAHAVKRNGKREAFVRHQFTESVRKVMHGRRVDAREAAHTATAVANCVLDGLAGQTLITTAQLAAGTIAVLRRVDDIAAIRYAAIAKSFESTRDFYAEAVDLLRRQTPAFDVSLTTDAPPTPEQDH